jgi:hypothetical protein
MGFNSAFKGLIAIVKWLCQHRLMVLVNRVLRKIFGLRTEEGTGE